MMLAIIDPFSIISMLIWNMAVAYGLSYLGGLLFGQEPKEVEDEPRGQSFAWRPRTTQQEGIPHPMCYGTNMHYGNVVARHTDVDVFGDEILYMILDCGRGPIKGVDIEGGKALSDRNMCIGGTPTFNILHNTAVSTWYQTAANINDDDKTTYVGFLGGSGFNSRGRYEAIVEFDSSTIDRIEYRRWWYIKGITTHTGYEKVYLWYGGAYHLVATKNFTTQGQSTDFIAVEGGGPWENVTKVKIECEINATKKIFGESEDCQAGHRLYELAAWRLRDTTVAGGSPVFINGQPAHNYKDVHIQGRLGTLNQTCMTGFEQNKLEYTPGALIGYGEPVTWTSPNNFFDDIEYTLAWPRGLCHRKDSGGLATNSVGVKIEISERDAEDWTTLFDGTVSAAQTQPLYKAYRVNEQVPGSVIHGKQYELKYTKTTEDKNPSRNGDELMLRSVREVADVAFTRPGRALLGVTALATARLSGHIDVNWVSDDKLVNVFDGSSWAIEFSRNRAFIYLDKLTQPVISGDGNGGGAFAIEFFEGLDPSRIDLAFIYKWAQFCDAQVPSGVGEETEARMPCDIICDQLTNVWSVAYEVAQIGRMTPYWQGHILTGWIDKATDESIDLITMDNTMARSWKSAYAGYGEMAGSAEVFYKDALLGYKRRGLPVPNMDAGRYTRIVQIEGVGVTGQAFATRVGRHAMKRNELIKNINSVRMSREALRYKLGRVVRIQNNVPNWGQAFRVVTSPSNNTVTLDRTVEGVSANDLLWVKTFNTVSEEISIDSYTVDSVAGAVVTIVETWEAGCTPLKDHLAAIGITGSIKLRRIVKMKHTQENYFDVELETYNTDLFPSDEDDPGLTNPDYVWPVTSLAELAVTRQEAIDLIASQVTDMLPALTLQDQPVISNCDWSGNDVDTVTWAKLDAVEPILLRWRGLTHEITADNTTDEFIYWDMDNPEVFSTTAVAATAAAALLNGLFLICTNKAGVPHLADLTVSTLQIINEAVTILTAAQDDAWWYLDPSPMAQAGFGIYRVGVWITEFTSTGFPCQIVFDTSVDGADLTSVSKSMYAIFRAVSTDPDLSISTITLVGAGVVKITTTDAHNLDTDDFVWSWDIVGTVELNDAICKITVIDGTNFTLQLTRSDWFTAYTSGGKVRHVSLWGLRYGFLYPVHDSPAHISVFDDYLDVGKSYQYIGAVRNRNNTEYAYINEGSTIIALEIKK